MDICDEIFNEAVEEIKADAGTISVVAEPLPEHYDNFIRILDFRYDGDYANRWLERTFSMFPGISRFKIQDGTEDDKYSYIVFFDANAISVFEFIHLFDELKRVVHSCNFCGIHANLSKYQSGHEIYCLIYAKIKQKLDLSRDEFNNWKKHLQKIEIDCLNCTSRSVEAFLADDFGNKFTRHYRGGYAFEDLKINLDNEWKNNMCFLYSDYVDLIAQLENATFTGTKLLWASFQFMKEFKDLLDEHFSFETSINRGAILKRELDGFADLIVVLELKEQIRTNLDNYQKQWVVYTISDNLELLYDILDGPKEKIDYIIREASRIIDEDSFSIKIPAIDYQRYNTWTT